MTAPLTSAKVELLIQDQKADAQALIGGRLRESRELELRPGSVDRFLDGPATRRLAIVDFDPQTGAPLPPPAPFRAPEDPTVARGTYDLPADTSSPAALAVNAFGTAFLTIKMFEGEDALGREVSWAFGSEQLLIVPRAGMRANAFYDRSTRSLQFFSFTDEETQATVHTALSRDIVAHECGHALLDAVVPSLYDSSTPQSIAIHEAVADLIALLMALDSKVLRQSVLARSKNTLDDGNAFARIAEEFGMAQLGPGGVKRAELRNLHNDSTAETLARARPHVLSTLLSAIFYDTLRQIFDARFERLRKTPIDDQGTLPRPDQAANKALGTAHMIFRGLLLRGIDYLPPGELSFADVGRAALAADRAVVPDEDAGKERRARRAALAQSFVARKLVADVGAMDSRVPAELDVDPATLPALRDTDYLAYDYVGRHREAIGIPADIPFAVLPRVDARKKVGREGDPLQRELILKVAWNHVESAHLPNGTEKKRLVPTGATIALDWATGRCLALVTSDIADPRHQEARDGLLARLVDEGIVSAGGPGIPDRLSLDDSADFVSLARSHRLLHLEGWDDE